MPPSDPLDVLLDRLDAIDAMAAMLFAARAGYPEGHRVVLAAACAAELVAMRLLRRGTIAPPAPGAPVAVEALVLHAEAATTHDVMAPARGEADPGDMETNPRTRFAIHQLLVYDPAIPDIEDARWPELFAPVEDELEVATGLTIEAIRRICESLHRRSLSWSLHHAQVSRPPNGIEEARYLLQESVRNGRGATVEPGSGKLFATSREQLSDAAQVTVEQVNAFLTHFATRPPAPDDPRSDDPFSRWVWDLRRRPVIEWDGRVMIPVPYDLVMSIRPTLEAVLRARDHKAGQRYVDHKSKWVERKAREILAAALDPDQSFRAIEVRAAPGRTNTEHDGLLRVDMVAIAIEAKGGGVPLSARRGQPDSQDNALQRLIHEGVAQADSLIAAIQRGESVTGVELDTDRRLPVDIGAITRWVPLVVTLEDMSGIVAASGAVFGDRDPERPHPVVLTLDDLVWYSQELPLAAQLVHYFVVRERIARSAARLTVYDETDWFRFYFSRGGAGVQNWLDKFERLDVQVLSQGSGTRRGVRDPLVAQWETPFEALLERWRNEKTDGWLEASIAMLDLGDAQSAQLPNLLREAAREAREHDGLAWIALIPDGDPCAAVHIGVPNRPVELNGDDMAPILAEAAPKAVNHVLLHAPSEDPNDLRLFGVATLHATGVTEADSG